MIDKDGDFFSISVFLSHIRGINGGNFMWRK